MTSSSVNLFDKFFSLVREFHTKKRFIKAFQRVSCPRKRLVMWISFSFFFFWRDNILQILFIPKNLFSVLHQILLSFLSISQAVILIHFWFIPFVKFWLIFYLNIEDRKKKKIYHSHDFGTQNTEKILFLRIKSRKSIKTFII